MTKRDFFRVIIKIIALYYLINMPSYLLRSLSFLVEGFYGSGLERFTYSAYMILSSAIIVGILLFLVFCSDWIIDLLRLDKGFDDSQINITKVKATQILEIGIVLIGGLTFITACPNLVYYGFDLIKDFFDSRMVYNAPENWSTQYFLQAIIQVVLGLVILSNYRRMSRYVFKQNEKNEIVEE